jgi:SpoIID/LytB domain protein
MLALLAAFGVVAFVPASFRAAAPSQKQNETERRFPPEPGVVRVGVAKPGGGYGVSEMPIEAYVARVLAGEAVRDSQPAALEALAITIRTFAVANRGRHRADGFDLCDQTHCQVLRAPTAAAERAANATAGKLLLLRDGAAAAVYYSASCGGHTAMPSEVWPGHENPPYLPSKRDDACDGTPEWTAELHEADLRRALRASGFVGELRNLRVAARTASGRVAQLRLDGVKPAAISGQDLRVAVGRTLGWQYIKSAAFDVQRKGAAYRFTGHGSGHGVGLCVIGSAKLAERGIAADAILARYFPGLTISGQHAPPGVGNHSQVEDTGSIPDPRTASAAPSIPDPRVTPPIPDPKHAPSIPDPRRTPSIPDPKRGAAIPDPRISGAGIAISLPDDDEGERATIERQALRARDNLARALEVPLPPRVTLRFHPTTDAYEQATGRAWFTSATLRNGEIHLLPPATLRDRGVLERTIRHELVHLMTDSVLGARPQWVREGAAIYFAGEPPIAGEPQQRPAFKPPAKPSCPADAELLRPVSVGALANAYARARACFARELQSGKSWRDVK